MDLEEEKSESASVPGNRGNRGGKLSAPLPMVRDDAVLLERNQINLKYLFYKA